MGRASEATHHALKVQITAKREIYEELPRREKETISTLPLRPIRNK